MNRSQWKADDEVAAQTGVNFLYRKYLFVEIMSAMRIECVNNEDSFHSTEFTDTSNVTDNADMSGSNSFFNFLKKIAAVLGYLNIT